MTAQFDDVSIQKRPNVHFNGKSISRVINYKDGTKKTIGVILPTQNPLKFKTHVHELIEVISGECEIWIGDEGNCKVFKAGESFYVPANSQFKIRTNTIVDYICHLAK